MVLTDEFKEDMEIFTTILAIMILVVWFSIIIFTIDGRLEDPVLNYIGWFGLGYIIMFSVVNATILAWIACHGLMKRWWKDD